MHGLETIPTTQCNGRGPDGGSPSKGSGYSSRLVCTQRSLMEIHPAVQLTPPVPGGISKEGAADSDPQSTGYPEFLIVTNPSANPPHLAALPGLNRGFWRRLGTEEASTPCFFFFDETGRRQSQTLIKRSGRAT